MDEDLRRKMNETFQAKLAKQEGKPAAPKSPDVAKFAGTSAEAKSGTFCDTITGIIDDVLGIVDRFSWFIPNRLENKIRAGLETVKEVVLPFVCGKPGAAA